jgi:hypothetical protein
MKNQVIEVLNKEHGKKVIEYWRSRGVDTSDFIGGCNKANNDKFRYYGLINNYFSGYSIEYCESFNAEIITLPEEKNYPRVMMVSLDEENWFKRVVFMCKNGRYLAWNNAETVEEAEKEMLSTAWLFAKDIEEPKEFTITLSDLKSKMDDIKKLFGISEKDKLVIKVD